MDLSNYVCTHCSSSVYRADGAWGCDCYEIPIRYLEAGSVDLPDFWIDTDNLPYNLTLPNGRVIEVPPQYDPKTNPDPDHPGKYFINGSEESQ